MKICVTSTEGSLNAITDRGFGRCNYFVIVDFDTMEFESIKNPAVSTTGGTGVKAAKSILDKGINVLITGNIGPNAFKIVTGAGIEVFSDIDDTVLETIEEFKKKKASPVTSPTNSAISGTRGCGKGRGYGTNN
ncbi:NifB/NifX family molybdenum-iron cluster-binding protein [Methanosalsum natronophilum]|uniref:NifB/NifX family molybdenum-iron cluster-binding protein n=1 Tax=Methanosalsum natronophilum TaxID=768733 RepID=UPI00216913A4|nr:NifB/NifX family molybdenum-iron cluster-binding protein [Methanosalsum natronophilum]MCS3924679.1 putative Fe-Mo cluster-binding NifX family protein [Methanosalsum natronophilum]